MSNGIHNDDELMNVFSSVIQEVMDNVVDRAYDLLLQHINTDVYGINKNEDGTPSCNKNYMDGTGTPSYEFRDKAWVKSMKDSLGTYIASIEYTPSNLSKPSFEHPSQHGDYSKDIDNTAILPDLLNVVGFSSGKERDAFWDNFQEELGNVIGQWMYTEFKKKGIDMPAIKYTHTNGWYK